MFPNTLLIYKEASKVFRISLALSYRLVAEGHLPGVLFGRTFGVRLENLDRFIAEIDLILIHPDPSQLSPYKHDLLSRNLQLEPGDIPCNGNYERDNDESFMNGIDCYIDTVHVGITVFQNSETLLKNIWKSNFQWYSSRSLTWLDSKKTKLAAETASRKNLQVNHPANGGFTYDR